MSKSKDVILAFLAGAAVGAIAGVLFAPDKGKNTREKLLAELENYKGKLKSVLDELVADNVSEGKEAAVNPAKAESDNVIHEAQREAEKLLHEVESIIDQIRTQKGS